MRHSLAFVAAILLSAVVTADTRSQPVAPDLQASVPVLRKNLEEAVIAFWYPRMIDRAHGGYRIAFDGEGRPTPDGSKMIVTQARMLWLSARLARAGYRKHEMLEAAAHGYRFLTERMWDPTHGGFVWEVDETGTQVADGSKVTYGQAFALYALAEYARASGDRAALAFADRVFDTIEHRAHDAQFSGYFEAFQRDWSALPAGARSPIGGAPGTKLMNTHLHLLEAYAEYFRAGQSAKAKERLHELIAIQGNTVVRKDLTACTDQYRRDWTPVLDEGGAVVSYGHDIENIWLLADAVETVGHSNALYLDLYRRIFDYSRRYGYDEAHGGYFYLGRFNAPAHDLRKNWWVQAEALMSALTMYRLTGEASYAAVFTKTLDWVSTRQTDWRHGEWFADVLPDGSTRGIKGDRWKEGYHNGRALILAIEIIQGLPPAGR